MNLYAIYLLRFIRVFSLFYPALGVDVLFLDLRIPGVWSWALRGFRDCMDVDWSLSSRELQLLRVSEQYLALLPMNEISYRLIRCQSDHKIVIITVDQSFHVSKSAFSMDGFINKRFPSTFI